jgi:hypothetical protein
MKIQETEHARQRRAERAIDKKDLKAALKYGEELPCKFGRKYTYNGITYIVSWNKKKEITCYASSFKMKKAKISNEMLLRDNAAKKRLEQDPSCWKSNTVIVVDTSGSMRESDVWGARSRLGAVWLCVALDFIAHRLESGNAGPYDVISLVFMGEKGHTAIKMMPTTWQLYNIIVDQYNSRNLMAKGHGFYIPSLKIAERILNYNKSSSCVLGLYFLSDGRPSDMASKDYILESVAALGKKFGRRLTFTAVGIGNHSSEFEVLKNMVDTAKDYGVQSSFMLPSMTTSDFGVSLTSTATTLTRIQTEMTDMKTLKQHNIREVIRESRRKAHEEVVTSVSSEEYNLYPLEKVQRHVYREWRDENRKRQHSYDVAPMQHSMAKFVAINKKVFGEGAERYAFRFFEVGEDGKTVVGKPLVAKESRLVLDGGEEHRDRFVRTFCQTQQLARRIADEFNLKLDSLYRVDKATPRVTFLDCSVYELDDVNLGKKSVLVEEKIDHMKWHKWNTNNGYIEGMEQAPEFTHDKMKAAFEHLAKLEEELRDDVPKFGTARNLGAIEEDDEDESEDNSEGTDSEDSSSVVRINVTPIKFTASEVAQAFSHFSYLATGRKRLICDLQGIFDEASNTLKFTDPVIHYYNYSRQERENVHGRTDRGRKGMAMFFETHKNCCGHLCRLVTMGFRRGWLRHG